MAKKTKKNARNFFEEEVFLDRDEARARFWASYEKVKQDRNIQVIMYYGLGGMGKTSLLRQIEKEITSSHDTIIWDYYDFNDGQDSVVVLRKIAKDLQQKYNYKFPVFLYAVYNYMLKCGMDVDAPEVKSVLDGIPVLREVFKVVNVIPGISTLSQPAEVLVDKICDTVDFVKKKQLRKTIEKINNTSKEKLHNDIPFVFVEELNENIRDNGNPVFVLFLDTYERLVNELSTVGTPIENDLWLRDDNDGILLQIDGLVCVLAGRENLKWKTMDPEWDEEVLSQVEIDTLDRENALLLLKEYGILGMEIQEKILEVTQGMPLYLDVCIDTYRSANSSGEKITSELFDNKIEKLARRLLTYMSDEEKDVLYLLSCLGRWSEEEFFAINAELGHNCLNNSVYSKILSFTFVRKEMEQFFIHQTMQEILIQYCEEKKIKKFIASMYNYVKQKNKFSTEYIKYLYLITRICGIRKNDELTQSWIGEIYPILEGYLDSFYLNQFWNIYEALPEESKKKDYRLQTLKLSFLLKKSYYAEAKECIEMFKPVEEDNIDVLKFYLTASYYYYIKGIDKEALDLRMKVYSKWKEILGEEHRETIKAGLSLAASYSRTGEHELSIELGNKCRNLLDETMGTYDAMISAAQNQLGDSYFRLGRMEEARIIYSEVYENRKNWLGEKNNSTMIAYNHIADCMVSMGEYEDALEIYEKVHEVRIQEFGRDKVYEYFLNGEKKHSNDHPDTIIVANNRAVCLIYMEKYSEAYEILQEVVAKRKVTLGEKAPATMGALENLALCEYYCGMNDVALEHIIDVISTLSEKVGQNHYDTIIAKYHKALIEGNDECKNEIINRYEHVLSFNSYYIDYMKCNKVIGYFSLGRYYE